MTLWHDVLQELPQPTTSDALASTSAATLESQAEWLAQRAKELAATEDARHAAFAHDETLASSSTDTKQAEAIRRLDSVWSSAIQHIKKYKRVEFPGGSHDTELDPDYEQAGAARFTVTDDDEDSEKHQLLFNRATWAARLLRNAVAGEAEGQVACFDIVTAGIFANLWIVTSHAFEGDEGARLLGRALIQLLCNLITDNEQLQGRLWRDHLQLQSQSGGAEPLQRRSGADLVARLLSSNDQGTIMAASILLVNLTAASKERCVSLPRDKNGSVIVRALLRVVETRLDEDEDEEEREEKEAAMLDSDSALEIPVQLSAEEARRKQQRFEGLGILYSFFTRLFDQGLLPDLYACIEEQTAPSHEMSASVITPSQITLLKLYDAYLHSQSPRQGGRGLQNASIPLVESCGSLVQVFVNTARWAVSAMQASMETTAVQAKPVDVRLVEVHVAMILLLQSVSNIIVASESVEPQSTIGAPLEAFVALLRSDATAEVILALLHTTNAFSPASSPFVPSKAAAAAAAAGSVPLEAPTGHALSSTGRAAAAQALNTNSTEPSRPRLDKLKRELVALLSVLAYAREGSASRREAERDSVCRFQDTVRERGGLVDVLNMTQLDEHNPYIREHAIFALRNLLKGNQESQDFIAQIRPIAPDASQ